MCAGVRMCVRGCVLSQVALGDISQIPQRSLSPTADLFWGGLSWGCQSSLPHSHFNTNLGCSQRPFPGDPQNSAANVLSGIRPFYLEGHELPIRPGGKGRSRVHVADGPRASSPGAHGLRVIDWVAGSRTRSPAFPSMEGVRQPLTWPVSVLTQRLCRIPHILPQTP